MLYLPDSNILIYAKMSGMPEHGVAFDWLDAALNDPNSVTVLCETTILSFCRITTNAKIFDPPLPFSDVGFFISDLLARSNVQLNRASSDHFTEVADFMKDQKLGGNLVMDVHLAILAMNSGAVLVSRDKDFLKIPYLKVLYPFEAGIDE